MEGEEENRRSLFFFLARSLRSLADVFEKNEKKKQRLCTGYVCTATSRSRPEV